MGKQKMNALINRLEEIFQYLTRRLYHEITQKMGKGITPSQFMVMKIINKKGRVTVSEVAEELCVSLSAITSLVDRLHKVNYVTRRRDEQDRRLVWLELTSSGEQILAECRLNRKQVLEKYFGQLLEEDLEKMVAIYEKLLKILQKEEKSGFL